MAGPSRGGQRPRLNDHLEAPSYATTRPRVEPPAQHTMGLSPLHDAGSAPRAATTVLEALSLDGQVDCVGKREEGDLTRRCPVRIQLSVITKWEAGCARAGQLEVKRGSFRPAAGMFSKGYRGSRDAPVQRCAM